MSKSRISPLYAEMKKRYQNGEFPDIKMRPGEGSEVEYWTKNGEFLQSFDSRLLAVKEYDKQWKRASKFIGGGKDQEIKTRAVKVIAANPVKRRPKFLHAVFTAAHDGIKNEKLAVFEKLSEAKKYAQAYADASGKRMVIETKEL